MKRVLSLKTLMIAGLIITLSGCITSPIYNVLDHPITHESGKVLTMEQISKAIFEAGNLDGWTMAQVRPGKIKATYVKPNYKAVINILYDQYHYSIDYANSRNLQYDGKSIHHNYNNWIVKLSDEIRKNLTNEFIKEYK